MHRMHMHPPGLIWLRIRILLSLSNKKSKKTLDFFCSVNSFGHFIFENKHGAKLKGLQDWYCSHYLPRTIFNTSTILYIANIEFRSELFITIVHQCYGSGMYHVYPGRLLIFTHLGSRIQKRQQKRGGESLFSYRIMYPQIKFLKNYRIFPQQNCHLSLNNLREFSKKSKRS